MSIDARTAVNRSMDRDDLTTEEGQAFVRRLSDLEQELSRRHLPITAWTGDIAPPPSLTNSLKRVAKRVLGRPLPPKVIGLDNRGGAFYEPVPGIADDDRHPWFLFWEAFWVMTHGPALDPTHRVLDAGGTGSLFSAYLASLGPEVDSVDFNPVLVEAGDQVSRAMGWRLRSHAMDMTALDFPDEHFDHAYSICVFEHLDAGQRQAALAEIARVLKPGGILSITFDYRGKGVWLAGRGPDHDPANLMRSPEDVLRHFGNAAPLELMGDGTFVDNGKSYLTWPGDTEPSYTFGGLFLQKR